MSPPARPRTRLVCTLALPRPGRGHAQDAPDYVERLVAAGMDVARVNLSHAAGASAFFAGRAPRYEGEEALLERVRAAGDAAGPARHVATLLDLQGVKIRLRVPDEHRARGLPFAADEILRMRITREPGATELSCDGSPGLLSAVAAALSRSTEIEVAVGDGDPILSCIGLEDDCALLRAPESGRLLHRKGVTFRGVELPDESNPTERDLVDLAAFVLPAVHAGRADFVALSFVRNARDVLALRSLAGVVTRWFRDGERPEQESTAVLLERVAAARPDLRERYRAAGRAPDPPLRVVAKIETRAATRAIDGILRHADAVMVARGDLGLQCRPEEVPVLQKDIVRSARLLGRPAVVATQMLGSMEHAPEPTRAESSDVFNAVLDGADALMLSGETAVGDRPESALLTLRRIASSAERWRENHPARGAMRATIAEIRMLREETMGLGPGAASRADVTDRITLEAVRTAEAIFARGIVAATRSGQSARNVARFDPAVPLIAVVPDAALARSLALTGSVSAIVAPADSGAAAVDLALARAVDAGLLRPGDRVVIVGAGPGDPEGATTQLIVRDVG